MKSWKSLAVLPFLALCLHAAESAVNEVALPEKILPQLDGILRGAVEQSPRMVSQALDLEIAAAARTQARAGLLPYASGYYNYNYSHDKSSYLYSADNPANSVKSYDVTKTPYAATLSQPVFFWGERKNLDRIGEIRSTVAKGQYREGYRLLVQELRADYLHLIVQKLAVKRAGYFLVFTNTQLKLQEDRFAKNVISAAEIATYRLNAEQAQIAQERTEFDFQTAKASFARLSGTPMLADESIPDAIPALTYAAGPFDQLLSGYLSQKDPLTNEAFNLREQIAIQRLDYSVQKTRLRPKVSFVLGLTQDEGNNLYGTPVRYATTSQYVGLNVNWTLFDGLASQAAVRASLATRRKLENEYRQVTERLAQDAQTQVKLINFSARSMVIYDRFATSGEGYLKNMQDDFARGVKAEADVSQAQLSLFDAQLSAYGARMDYLLKTGEFLGMLVEDPVLANITNK